MCGFGDNAERSKADGGATQLAIALVKYRTTKTHNEIQRIPIKDPYN